MKQSLKLDIFIGAAYQNIVRWQVRACQTLNHLFSTILLESLFELSGAKNKSHWSSTWQHCPALNEL